MKSNRCHITNPKKSYPQCNFCSRKKLRYVPQFLNNTVPLVCRKWGIPFSLVKASRKYYFGRHQK